MMTFLNPFVLFGLAAAAIPVLIHLFNVRKLRTIEFSTLTFLKELNKNKIRRIKVRQWLLLALRTLLIILIVLAFSRPALQGTFGTAASRASSTIVIVLDNTASMGLHNEQGTFLAQAKLKARAIAATMQENDEAYLLRLSDLPLATTEEPLRDPSALAERIDATELSMRYRSIEEALRVTSRLLGQSRNFNKEIYLLTDGQRSTLISEAEDRPNSNDRLFDPSVRLFLLPLSGTQQENVAVERMEVPPSLLQPGRPFTARVTVVNHGTAPISNHVVTMKIGAAAVMQKSVTLGAGERTTVEFPLTVPNAGFLPLTAESEDDAFEPDNRYYSSLFVPPQVAVAVIAADPVSSRYLLTALGTAGSAADDAPVKVRSLTPSQLSPSMLAGQDVIVLSGLNSLSAGQTDDLRKYITAGGALLFFPSPDTLNADYRYLSEWNIPALLRVTAPAGIASMDRQSPLFRGMFDADAGRSGTVTESPQIQQTLAPPPSASVRTVITLSTGVPLLWQSRSGNGTILGFAVPATTAWSDLPLKGLFVPLIFQSVLYSASPASVNTLPAWSVGEPLEFSTALLPRRSAASAGALRFVDAAQRDIPAVSYSRSGGTMGPSVIYNIERTEAAGHYTAYAARDTAALLPVNVSRMESDGIPAAKSDIDGLRGRVGIGDDAFAQLSPDADIVSTVMESRFGIELWRYFLIAALLVALAEMAVAREGNQQGTAGTRRSGRKDA
ncbi:MAG: BatA domain-containing protein [Bacteroidetes bacterium]|nr:BatA domain-containing protein [Bacteroidota bacterium]